MPRLTPEQAEEQLTLAKFLIEEGRVTNWKQLGQALGISRQAAAARFGPDGYGLEMPRNGYNEVLSERFYLSLTDDLAERLKRARQGKTSTVYLRELLDEHLPA